MYSFNSANICWIFLWTRYCTRPWRFSKKKKMRGQTTSSLPTCCSEWSEGNRLWNKLLQTQVRLMHRLLSVQFSHSVMSDSLQPMDCSTPGLPVHNQLLEFTETHVHWVGDAFQPSHPLLSPSLPTFSLSLHQGLFKWVSSSHQVAKILECQFHHQSFQWIFRTDFL